MWPLIFIRSQHFQSEPSVAKIRFVDYFVFGTFRVHLFGTWMVFTYFDTIHTIWTIKFVFYFPSVASRLAHVLFWAQITVLILLPFTYHIKTNIYYYNTLTHTHTHAQQNSHYLLLSHRCIWPSARARRDEVFRMKKVFFSLVHLAC